VREGTNNIKIALARNYIHMPTTSMRIEKGYIESDTLEKAILIESILLVGLVGIIFGNFKGDRFDNNIIYILLSMWSPNISIFVYWFTFSQGAIALSISSTVLVSNASPLSLFSLIYSNRTSLAFPLPLGIGIPAPFIKSSNGVLPASPL